MKKIILLALFLLLAGCSNPIDKESSDRAFRVKVTTLPDITGVISPSPDSMYAPGDTVSLQASSAAGYVFTGWSGDLSSTENPYSLIIDRDYSIRANFDQTSYELIIQTEGNGTVTEEVVRAKSTDYEYGTEVRLTAHPERWNRFIRWEGDISSEDNPVTVTMEEPMEVTAVFGRSWFPFKVQVVGGGSVSQETLETDNSTSGQVQLTAVEEDGWQFVRWEGSLSKAETKENPVVVNADGDTEVSAYFYKKLGGTIRRNTTLKQSEGPYILTDKVRVSEETRLRIERGVHVIGDSRKSAGDRTIEVFGTLEVKGTREDEVILENVVINPGSSRRKDHDDDDDDDDWDDDDDDDRDDDRDDDDDWEDDRDDDDLYRINIEHAVLIGGELHSLPETPVYGSINLKNSFLYKVNRSRTNDKYLNVWYPRKKCTIEQNIFYNTGRISTSLSREEVKIKNNYFYRNEFLSDGIGYAVENRAGSRRARTEVEENTFANTGGIALSYTTGFSDKRMEATKNYWGTTSVRRIDRMIYDSNDNRRIRREISYQPYSRNSHGNTPALPDSLR